MFVYKIIAVISTIVRQFCIANPFEALGDGMIVTIGDIPMLFPPDLLNWGAEPFMHWITFRVVGMYYDKGSAPALGSFLYLSFYCIHTFVLWLMSVAGFATWAIMFIIGIYAGVHIVFNRIVNHSF